MDGIELVLGRMAANTSLPDHSAFAVDVLRDQYSMFMDDFVRFFPLIIQYLEDKYEIEISASRESYPNC